LTRTGALNLIKRKENVKNKEEVRKEAKSDAITGRELDKEFDIHHLTPQSTETDINIITDKKNYIFLDEIQHVDKFEKVVDSLFIKENVDLYITGSNAYFMSSELATLLSGRYIELKMLPLSFKEFIDFSKIQNPEKIYSNEEYFEKYLIKNLHCILKLTTFVP